MSESRLSSSAKVIESDESDDYAYCGSDPALGQRYLTCLVSYEDLVVTAGYLSRAVYSHWAVALEDWINPTLQVWRRRARKLPKNIE